MSIPLIAIVGRPNVGKSTFFNRVLSQRQAIVDSTEGITRDRIYGEAEWCGQRLMFIDTGGFIPDDADIFNAALNTNFTEDEIENLETLLAKYKEDGELQRKIAHVHHLHWQQFVSIFLIYNHDSQFLLILARSSLMENPQNLLL